MNLARNFGQHPAILAAFQHVTGDAVITLDADLQNPPEEIPKLLAKLDEGYDVVGGIRQQRQDTLFRRSASKIVNKLTTLITGMKLQDYGCMLRGYSREVINAINLCQENSTFIPALGVAICAAPN
ncbi:MAG: glycosyltransferase [Nibricoccus sp.]